MSAPYWGQLPGPKTGQTKARRLSDDVNSAVDPRQSLDVPVQGHSRSNRVSVQTTKSDAPTDSTLSPFVSPTASSFQGQGLAPRPPSLPYGVQYPPELLENRRRRQSRNQEPPEPEYTSAPAPPLPAAPDVPRAPPVSYKYPAGSAVPPPGIFRTNKQMEVEEYIKASTPVSQKEDHPVLDRASNTLDASAIPRTQRNNTDPALARHITVQDVPNGHQRRASGTDQLLQNRRRRASGSQPTDRVRMKIIDRSPLQRLELTLEDQLSKEDKRARAEAAERAARERAAADGAPQGNKSPVAPVTPVTPTKPPQGASAQNGPLSQNPPEEGRRYPLVRAKSPRNKTQDSRIPVPLGGHASGIPQRNLSFRERAAKNDIKPPNGLDEGSHHDASPTTNGGSVARSGSNKLKKTPPSDPWPPRESLEPITPVRYEGGPVRTYAPQKLDFSPMPRRNTEPSDRSEDEVTSTSPTTGKLVKNPSQRKAEQIFGRELPQFVTRDGARRSPAFGGNGPSPPPAAVGGYRARRDARSESDSDEESRHVSDLVYHARDKLQPGRGVFKPTEYLEEWKGAPVGALSGDLVDLDDLPPAVEKGATWWETSPSRRRSGSISARPRKGEAFEGEYDDTNGMQISHPKRTAQSMTRFMVAVAIILAAVVFHWRIKFSSIPTALDSSNAALHPIAALRSFYLHFPKLVRQPHCLICRPLEEKEDSLILPACSLLTAPTRFKPPLYLKCGPLLRYCGIRHERVPSRSTRNGPVVDREIWRGSVMIVTTDADSSYDIAPTLRMFVQPIELLPPPPREINGDEPLAPEYVDPLAGHPKLGRKGETLYVRPVDHLEEEKDLSRDETDEGLFEKSKSPPDFPLKKGVVDPPGSFAARRKRADIDGEKAGKFKDCRGFRLHAERGYTFWRFNIEVELRDKEQRIAYRINRGPSTGFWVPAKGQTMNIMFHSCNGFSMSVNPDTFSGPDPMWRDVLNTHQSQPFHVMIGGGDQIYNDKCMQETKIFKEWLMIRNPLHKHKAPFTAEMQNELEEFYLERYCMWFSQGLFGMANSQIPMVNMFDDHDIIDGFGSYPHHFMNSPVFSGLGNVAFKYYMLFQHQSVTGETEKDEPSWTLGIRPGPYITEHSRSLFMNLGAKVALLAVDARTERTREGVITQATWKKIMDRCFDEIDRGKTEHLLVLLGVPIAYPRLVWLENILTSRIMDPIKALGKTGMFGHVLNTFDGGVEVLDDLDDHWTAKNHKEERSIIIEDLQDLAGDKSIRVTILSGDVHLAAVGQFYSNPKLGIPKHKDFRYIPNVISSAIVNTPPPDLMADILNKRNKVHHFDKETDEDMIPIFSHGVDSKPRNNKHLLPHRNWCSIRPYVPGNSPPATPEQSAYDLTPGGSPPGTANGSGGGSGIFRRLSFSKSRNRGPSFRGPDSVRDRARPPVSGGLLRALSRKGVAASADAVNTAGQQQRPPGQGLLTRTLSGSSINGRFGSLFRRRPGSAKRGNDGGINGTWGDEETEEEDIEFDEESPRVRGGSGGRRGIGLRGGLGDYPHEYSEFEDGDENYFSAQPSDVPHQPDPTAMSGGAGPVGMTRAAAGGSRGDVVPEQEFAPKPFHRTPTGLTAKQMKHAEKLSVNLEGGLEISLNVEISPKDPGGSTVPYRLVVPRLWYEYEGSDAEPKLEKPVGGIKRLLSLRKSD
ncbi:hypothetical protein B0T25DRAFT_465324 [Lasiosphaeria hispida]|uniref:PhoD-like phosphatase domain-containing protein n=1 Tax=Lasiosphaeria hispida TaxID=260671 RepID=A0AAJ0H5Q0_9PEZI|nr:hypothetical protein B0T25DRAFT_465324 [Lasiosphaeria hispida]